MSDIPKAVKRKDLNDSDQFYRGVRLNLIKRNYDGFKAKRFTLNGTNQNVWIPNKHLEPDGTIKDGQNIDYVLRRSRRQLHLAGYDNPIM